MPNVLPQTLPPLTSHRIPIDARNIGYLHDSSDALGNVETLRQRMQRDGYLFLPGLLNKDWVMEARKSITDKLATAGVLDPNYPSIESVSAGKNKWGNVGHGDKEMSHRDGPVFRVLYSGAMLEFFARFLGGTVRHYDFTWYRVVPPGAATNSHCDIVYMGRGTPNVYTSWTPLGDVPFDHGGLMILEGSNNNQRLKSTYGKKDVDAYCVNKTGRKALDGWNSKFGGNLSPNPNQIQRSLGGRWVTADYKAGDVLIFSMFTVHASTDNISNRIRISTDSRYQLASEPADERWIGENPPAHGKAGKLGKIC